MLMLKQQNLQEQVASLFHDLNIDEELRTTFIQNPANVIAERFCKKARQQVSKANQLLFSLISNKKFRKWIREYSRKYQNKDICSQQFITDFAQAVIRFSDAKLVQALASGAMDQNVSTAFSDNNVEAKVVKQYSVAIAEGFAVYNRQYAITKNKTRGPQFDPDDIITSEMVRAISEYLVARGLGIWQTGAVPG
uniref:Uncharacterized protein n=1 Tax=Thermosporothrix sp. COM3 TaxID=2490863 RepID=A0A455SK29_9CHLR|nr:hypothetical protein KTC_20700 [Thermosporothrix sp. COM3]